MEGVYIVPEANWVASLFVFLSLAVLTTILRLYVRVRVIRSWGLDDVLITIAMAVGILHSIFQYLKTNILYRMIDVTIATGREPDLQANAVILNRGIRFSFIVVILYLIELPLIKCSILAFYLRLAKRWSHSYLIYAVGLCIIANSVAHIICKFCQFDPFRALWMFFLVKMPVKKRISPEVLEIINTSFQSLADIVLLALPVHPLYKMHLPKSKKVALVAVYCFGFFSLAATLTRLAHSITFWQKIGDRTEGRARNPQFTFWTQIELATAIMCANVPGIFALLRAWTPFRFSDSSGTRFRRSYVPSFVQPSPEGHFTPNALSQLKFPNSPKRQQSTNSTADVSVIHASTEIQVEIEDVPKVTDEKNCEPCPC